MNNKYKVIILVIILVIAGVLVFIFENKQNSSNEDNNSTVLNTQVVATTTDSDSNSPASSNETVSTSTGAMQSTDQLFAKSPDYAKAFLVYPTINAAAQKALAGFNVTTKDLGNGITQVSLPTKTQTDEIQTFTVTKGQKVYFVEKSMGDDSLDTDRNLADDYGVAVDASGYILK